MKRLICVLVLVMAILVAVNMLAISADWYEADNNFTLSNNIPTNASRQQHNFHAAGDVDYVNFSAEAGSTYVIETHLLTSAGITDTVLDLYGTDGTTLITSNDDVILGEIRSSRIIWKATSTGTFFVRAIELYNSSGGSYDLTITKVGDLIAIFISPANNTNVTRHGLFNVTAQLTCFNGTCLNITAYLDPKEAIAEGVIDKEVTGQLDENKIVPVIVYLSGEPDSPSGEIDKLMINSQQEKVLSEIDGETFFSGPDFNLKYRYTSINAIAGNITKSGLKKLKNNPDVLKVAYDETMHITLDSSVPAINGDDAWAVQYSGRNITGAGETICIIDTGINYTHPDFGNCNFTSNINGGSCAKVIGGYDFVNGDANPMDDHSHGSHVAGIAASNGTAYRGVAPYANIVAIKSCNSAGSCSSSNVISGIDWCISNKSAYNISVISMSLGESGSKYNEHCNHSETPYIDSAYDAGIIVTIAAGNDAYTDGISTPACSQKATSIGSVTDADALSSFSDRGIILDLLTPGSSITATNYAGGHLTQSGTSMSAPHAAGAAAMIAQAGKLRLNRTLTPLEIEHILKYNAVNVYDSGSNLRFPRIDVYNAVSAKGIISTNVSAIPFYTLNSNPSNATCLNWLTDGQTCNITWAVNATGNANTTWEFFAAYIGKYNYNATPPINISIADSYVTLLKASDFYNGPNVTLNCSAYSSFGLSNITLYTNAGGSWLSNATMSVSGVSNESNFSLYNLADGSYIWNCLARDINNLAIWAAQNYTLNVDTVSLLIDYVNKTSVISLGSYQAIYANVTDTSISSVNISIAGQNITLSNLTASQYNYSRFDYANGTVNFSIFALDRAGHLNVSYDSYFVNDTTDAPEIYSVAIANITLPYGSQQAISSIVLESYQLSSVLLNHNGTNITMNNLSSYNYSYSWNTSQCGNVEYKVYAQNILNYSALYASAFNTTGCCGNSICESGEGCGSCSSDCGACATITSSSTGGGGGGGGSSSAPLSNVGFLLNEATPDKPIKIEVNSKAIPVKDIEIKITEAAESVRVIVNALPRRPESLPAPNNAVSYFEISSKELAGKIESARIDFEVPETDLSKSFISPEDVALLRYDGRWAELPTSYLGKVAGIYRYSATTPGFSYFAIAEASRPAAKPKAATANESASVAQEENETIGLPAGNEPIWLPPITEPTDYSKIILAIVIMGLLSVFGYHPIKKLIRH